MLIISKANQVNGTLALRLEGRVIGPWVSELQQLCEPLLCNGGSLTLDVAEVTFADETGVALLSGLRLRGVELLHVTPFLAAQLQETRR